MKLIDRESEDIHNIFTFKAWDGKYWRDVSVSFKNKEFVSCAYDITGTYNLDQWKAMKVIAERIFELQENIVK